MKITQHTKGQRHPSKTKWLKVFYSIPIIDDENPELVKSSKVKFIKNARAIK